MTGFKHFGWKNIERVSAFRGDPFVRAVMHAPAYAGNIYRLTT